MRVLIEEKKQLSAALRGVRLLLRDPSARLLQRVGRGMMGRRRAEILGKGFPYLVAELGGHVVGYAYANHYRPRIAYRFSVEDSIYVAPDAPRKGIGRALLSNLIARCTGQGYRQMVAVIGDTQNLGSVGLHAALGFRVVGTLPSIGFKHGRWVDSVFMQRPLGPGDSSLPNQQTKPD